MMNACSTSPSGLLSEMQHAEMSEEEIKKVVVDLILAAGDTVSPGAILMLFIYFTASDKTPHMFRQQCPCNGRYSFWQKIQKSKKMCMLKFAARLM